MEYYQAQNLKYLRSSYFQVHHMMQYGLWLWGCTMPQRGLTVVDDTCDHLSGNAEL